MKSFENKVAVVTGAASGIGRALSVKLAEAHAHVALVDVSGDALAEVADAIARHGGELSTHRVDVSNAEDMMALAEEVLQRHGQVDLMINNAGVTTEATFLEQSLEDMHRVMEVNFWGVIHGCRAFLPHLLERPEGALVNVSSLFGLIGVPTQSIYCASKYAVRGLSEALWEELAYTDVTVTLVHPGGVRTNIMESARYYRESSKEVLVEYFEKQGMPAEKCAGVILDAVRNKDLRVIVAPIAVRQMLAVQAPSSRNPLVALLMQEMGIDVKERL